MTLSDVLTARCRLSTTVDAGLKSGSCPASTLLLTSQFFGGLDLVIELVTISRHCRYPAAMRSRHAAGSRPLSTHASNRARASTLLLASEGFLRLNFFFLFTACVQALLKAGVDALCAGSRVITSFHASIVASTGSVIALLLACQFRLFFFDPFASV